MSKFYQISTANFADKHGNFELLSVADGLCIVQSNDELGEPFIKLDRLPQNLQDELNARLENAKKSKIESIDYERDKAINAGVEYKGHIFQSEENDRNLLTSAAVLYQAAGGVPENFVWISKDNEQVPFTLADIIALGAKMAQNESLSILKARTLKDKVLAATTLKEVEAIQWA